MKKCTFKPKRIKSNIKLFPGDIVLIEGIKLFEGLNHKITKKKLNEEMMKIDALMMGIQ